MLLLPQVDDEELRQALTFWEWVRGGAGMEKWSPAWGVAALAGLQRVELTLAAHMDRLYNLVGEGKGQEGRA